MFLGTAMIAIASARASGVCGTCMFISSPSKSALYGDVTLRLRRKVEWGRMRTRWPIIDILCSEGCLLNSTMSPFCRCLSTRKPYSRWRSASRRTKRRSSRWPSSRTMNLAPVCPGGGCGPLATSAASLPMLCGVTDSGTVSVSAIDHGTPSSSSARFGSPEMTVRAEKSTRLPIRFPRTRPSLPLSRCEIDLIGRPDRCAATGCPGLVLSM